MVFTNTTSPPPSHQQQNDDISLFLRQILHRSSSSSYDKSQPLIPASSPVTPMRTHAHNHNYYNNYPGFNTQQLNSGSDRVSNESLNGVVLPHVPLVGSLTGSVQLRSCFDNNNNEFLDDNDFDSEEREEAVVEEVETKQQQTSRNQSKRSRAAEVHNLSEKRRRSRINEKMKALQNLIPNSNKTDKASMLDEAIEYLKQLQLQVQMLSLRNGLSLHPMCMPGGLHPSQLSQLGINFENGSGSYDINLTNAVNNTQPETSNTILNHPNQCTSVRPSLPIASTINDSVAMPYGRESCMPSSFGPFQLHNSSQAICRERGMPLEKLVDNIEMESSVTTFSRPGYTQRKQQKVGSQETLLENESSQNQLISSNFNGLLATSSNAQMTS